MVRDKFPNSKSTTEANPPVFWPFTGVTFQVSPYLSDTELEPLSVCALVRFSAMRSVSFGFLSLNKNTDVQVKMSSFPMQ